MDALAGAACRGAGGAASRIASCRAGSPVARGGGTRTAPGSVTEMGDAQIAASNAAAPVVQTDFQIATARAQLCFALGRARTYTNV
jgi:outer membrane protein